jgi:hypothetical protein
LIRPSRSGTTRGVVEVPHSPEVVCDKERCIVASSLSEIMHVVLELLGTHVRRILPHPVILMNMIQDVVWADLVASGVNQEYFRLIVTTQVLLEGVADDVLFFIGLGDFHLLDFRPSSSLFTCRGLVLLSRCSLVTVRVLRINAELLYI